MNELVQKPVETPIPVVARFTNQEKLFYMLLL
jgi:hypothetical protein